MLAMGMCQSWILQEFLVLRFTLKLIPRKKERECSLTLNVLDVRQVHYSLALGFRYLCRQKDNMLSFYSRTPSITMTSSIALSHSPRIHLLTSDNRERGMIKSASNWPSWP